LLFAYFFVSRCRPISSQYSHDCEFWPYRRHGKF
jgi:hypothetical protein